MKKKIAIVAFLLLIAAEFIFLRPAEKPRLSFVGMETTRLGTPIARIRATNSSDVPFFFFGFAKDEPICGFTFPGLNRPEEGWSFEGGNLKHLEVPAHASMDFLVTPPVGAASFSAGVYFSQDRAEKFHRSMANPLSNLYWAVLPKFAKPKPIWSDIVHVTNDHNSSSPESH